jgi:hypothetical protein
VNPQWHDEFVALCALFPSGELTEEEWALLQVHLAYCDSCRIVFDEYQQLVKDVIPVMAASAVSELDETSGPASFSLEEAEQRLMSRLNSDGPVDSTPKQQIRSWKLPLALIAACVAILSGLIGLSLHHSEIRPVVQSASTSSAAEKTRLEEKPGKEVRVCVVSNCIRALYEGQFDTPKTKPAGRSALSDCGSDPRSAEAGKRNCADLLLGRKNCTLPPEPAQPAVQAGCREARAEGL